MRILMVSHEYPPIGGGGANACMNLAREYSVAGHTVDIVTVWYAGEEEVSRQENVTIYRIKSKRKHAEHCSFSEMLDYMVKAYPISKKLAKSSRYDICQVFFGIPSGPIGYLLKKKYGIPYVIRFGGGDIPGFQDRFATIYRLIGPAIKSIWKNADALVANSIGLKQMAEGFCDKKEILVIPNGATPHEIDEESIKHTDEDDEINLLFVSRLIERKGLQDIIPQLSSVRKKCLDNGKDIRLSVVGDGPYRDTLEDLVDTEDIKDVVYFCGQKRKDELPKYYMNADIFIFPSRKEGMPNVVLEAMSYGLPIIMTPCQGSEELIDGNGVVVDSAGMGSVIVKLATNPDLRKSYADRSLQLIKENFNWRNTANEYALLFEKIITV